MSKLDRAQEIARERQTALGRKLGFTNAHGATLRCSDIEGMRTALVSLAEQFGPPKSLSDQKNAAPTLLAQAEEFAAAMQRLRATPPVETLLGRVR